MFLITTILVTSALSLGVYIASTNGMVFQKIRWILEARNDKNVIRNECNEVLGSNPSIYDAILLCHLCMPSLWSIFGYLYAALILGNFETKYILLYPITVGATSVLNGIIWGLYNKLNN